MNTKNIPIDELLEELRKSNAEMANAMREMQEELHALKQEKTHPIHSVFRNTVKDVVNSANTCDDIIRSLQKQKASLRTDLCRRVGNLRHMQTDSDLICAVEETYLACSRDIDQTIRSVSQMKEQLGEDTVSTAAQLKDAVRKMGTAALGKVKELLSGLSDRANLIRANAMEKQADSHRKSAKKLRKVRSAIIEMDRGIYKQKLRFKNVMHALKNESFETPGYVLKGLAKKLADVLEEDCGKELRHSGELQNKADAIKAFCGKPEGTEHDLTVQDEDGIQRNHITM